MKAASAHSLDLLLHIKLTFSMVFFFRFRFFNSRLIFFINVRISLLFYIKTTFVPKLGLKFAFHIACIIFIIFLFKLNWFKK